MLQTSENLGGIFRRPFGDLPEFSRASQEASRAVSGLGCKRLAIAELSQAPLLGGLPGGLPGGPSGGFPGALQGLPEGPPKSSPSLPGEESVQVFDRNFFFLLRTDFDDFFPILTIFWIFFPVLKIRLGSGGTRSKRVPDLPKYTSPGDGDVIFGQTGSGRSGAGAGSSARPESGSKP